MDYGIIWSISTSDFVEGVLVGLLRGGVNQ
jgi:hypothetical protein